MAPKETGTLDSLYAIAVERQMPDGNWSPDMVYTKAENSGHAMFILSQSEPLTSNYRIVAAAPVVGYFALDKDEKRLTV